MTKRQNETPMTSAERLAKLRAKPQSTARQPHADQPAKAGRKGGKKSALKLEGGMREVATLPDGEPIVPASEIPTAVENTACTPTTSVAESETEMRNAPIQAQAGEIKMTTFTLKGLNKRGTQAIYTGSTDGENGGRVRTAVRVPLAAFANKTAPQTFTAEAPFAVRGKSRSEMTPEERKAARQNRPKLTLAEKAKKAEERAARLRAQLESQAQTEQHASM